MTGEEPDHPIDYMLRTYYNTAIMERYYGYLSRRYSRLEKGIEILIAVGATGSSVSGWTLWQHEWGRLIWATIAGFASVLAISKPILSLRKYTLQYDNVCAGFMRVNVMLLQLIDEAAYDPSRTSDIFKSVGKIRKSILGFSNHDQRIENHKELMRLDEVVRKQIISRLPEKFRETFAQISPIYSDEGIRSFNYLNPPRIGLLGLRRFPFVGDLGSL
jgi:hypothetical protein